MMHGVTHSHSEGGWVVARVYKLLIAIGGIGGRVAGGLEQAGYSLR